MEMENFVEIFCRLCGNTINSENSKVIDTNARGALGILLLELNLDGDKHLMCNACSTKLFAALDFKMTCLNTNNCVLPYAKSEENGLLDLREIYLKQNNFDQLNVESEDQNICRLCTRLIPNEYVRLEEVDALLNKYIPEMQNFSFTKNPVVCRACYESLNVHCDFFTMCLDTEERIKHVSDTKNSIKMEVVEIKIEYTDPNSNTNEEVPEHNEIKRETDQTAPEQSNQQSQQETKQSYICDECKYEAKNIKHFERHMFAHAVPNADGMFRCHQCIYETYEKHFFVAHHLFHRNSQVYKTDQENNKDCCTENQPPQTSSSQVSLESKHLQHKITQEDVSEAQKYRSDKHKLFHNDSCAVPVYKCKNYDFQTNNERNLTTHVLVHKDVSEAQMYNPNDVSDVIKQEPTDTQMQCEQNLLCNFQAKRKHELVNKDAAETQMYKCDKCHFQTKNKCNFTTHQFTHKDPSEETVYKCEKCYFQTNKKQCLATHQMVHRVEKYKCNECQFQTRYMRILNVHRKKHANSDMRVYKCDKCNFETVHKKSIRPHQMRHKPPSEVPKFKCAFCSYETRHKWYLPTHQLIHHGDTLLKSGICKKYITERREYLRKRKRKYSRNREPDNV